MNESEHTAIFQAPEIEEIARLFPSYDVHCLIACGGMGAVYQATQRSLDRGVAIKVLPREFSVDEEFRKGFESEAKAMAKLNHPNLIGVYDFGEVDGMLYIIMEYVAGKSLFHSAHGHAVDQADAIRIVIATCAGLANAHQHGVLHRDIKPANILLDSNANPKIGDFGLARALESKIEEGEQIFGTPGYTAPEVLEPPYSFDQRADIFSVGVMLHELLTGQLPEADPRPASQISPCSQRLDAVIRKATHPDPALRYMSAMELAQALESIANSPGRALATGGATAARANNLYAPPKYTAKSSGSGGLVLIVVLLVAGAVGAVVFFGKQPKPEPAPIVEPEPKVVHIEVAPIKKPEVVEKVVVEPAFDPVAFLSKSRSKMGGKIGPFEETRKTDLASNVNSLEIRLESAIRELELSERRASRRSIRENVASWKADGDRIPETLPTELEKLSGALDAHRELLLAQEKIDETLAEGIASQSRVYVLAIENQIELLERAGDQASADALKAEVAKVKGEEGYFISLFSK